MERRVVELPFMGRKPTVSLSEDNSALIGPFSLSAGWVSPLFSESPRNDGVTIAEKNVQEKVL